MNTQQKITADVWFLSQKNAVSTAILQRIYGGIAKQTGNIVTVQGFIQQLSGAMESLETIHSKKLRSLILGKRRVLVKANEQRLKSLIRIEA